MKTNPDGGEHALDMGDLIADAGYYRLTKSEADREYARMKKAVDYKQWTQFGLRLYGGRPFWYT